MQCSMTGYGRCEKKTQRFLIKCEIKTLNSKFLDFSPRIAKELTSKETVIRNKITEKLKRGKVMLTLELEVESDENQKFKVDELLFKSYYDKFLELSKMVNGPHTDLVKTAIEAPEVIKQHELSEEDIPWEEIEGCLASALTECIDFRKQEGDALTKKLEGYIEGIRNGLSEVELADVKRDQNIRLKLHKSLDEIREKVKVDENRFEQELIYYLERLDISEEKVRLKQHLDFFTETIMTQPQAGKKLGFIAQEIGREINTIGSKANDAEIQRTVVVMKDDLEKIKEQSLNLL